MKVIFHPTYGMNIDIQLSTNARNVSPQFGPKFAVYRFVPAFRAEHHMHDVLCVGMRHVPHLRCSAFLYTTHPALTRWAKVCRASGAGRNANSPFSSRRLRAGLKYVAPPVLERGRADTAREEVEGSAGGRRYIRREERSRHSGCCPESSMRTATRTGAQGGACLRRGLSGRGGVRRVPRASGGPGGRACAENPGPDGRP